jgi:predicted enzyme related to lactoylglutathione lyase
MPKIVHFELNTDDPLRAKGFYEKVFNWKIEKSEMPMEYWMITAGPEDEQGINGGLQKREETADIVTNYIGVPSIDEFSKKIEANGGTIINPKSPIPGTGYFALFKDTEGNKLGIFESDESAQM